MRKAREALKALPPEQREELRFQDLGPGDAYIIMWRALNLHRKRISDGIRSEADWRYHMERIVDCCTSLMPFEKVRLAPVKVSGDPNAPHMYSKVDLSHLPDEDIHALARILPKLGGGTANGAQGDAAGHARGDAAPNRAEGARSDLMPLRSRKSR